MAACSIRTIRGSVYVCVNVIFYGRIECHSDMLCTRISRWIVDKQIQLIENYLFILLLDGMDGELRSCSQNSSYNNNSALATPINQKSGWPFGLLYGTCKMCVCAGLSSEKRVKQPHVKSIVSRSLFFSVSVVLSFRFPFFFVLQLLSFQMHKFCCLNTLDRCFKTRLMLQFKRKIR